MIELKNARIPIPGIEQVCIVVRDVQQKMEALGEAFGIGPWSITTYEPDSLYEVKCYGKDARLGMHVARAKWGPMELELIQPTTTEDIYSDFLNTHGEGRLHHVGWYKVDNLAQTTTQMEASGFACLMSGKTYRSRFAYYDTSAILATYLEAIEVDESVPAREPDRIWPE